MISQQPRMNEKEEDRMNVQSGWQRRKIFQYIFVAIGVAFAVVGSVAFARA
jgi:hypothetical protein